MNHLSERSANNKRKAHVEICVGFSERMLPNRLKSNVLGVFRRRFNGHGGTLRIGSVAIPAHPWTAPGSFATMILIHFLEGRTAMAEADRIRWNSRYAAQSVVLTDPDPVVVRLLSSLEGPGRAVDVASGPGRHTLWLAARHWHVTALDVSEVALARLQTALRRHPDFQVDVRCLDLDGWRPPSHHYDLGVMTFFWDEQVLMQLRRAIRPGGHLILRTFLSSAIPMASGAGRHYVDRDRLDGLLRDWDVWERAEDPRAGMVTVAARRPSADS